jgi:hypothetical protein
LTDEQKSEPTASELLCEDKDEPKKGHAKVPRLSDDELREFVNDFTSGLIFSNVHFRSAEEEKSLLGSVFMPLVFGALSRYSVEEIQNIGLMYEHINKAGPMAINGYPIFFSMRLMHKDDWDRARIAIQAETERRKGIELPPKEA